MRWKYKFFQSMSMDECREVCLACVGVSHLPSQRLGRSCGKRGLFLERARVGIFSRTHQRKTSSLRWLPSSVPDSSPSPPAHLHFKCDASAPPRRVFEEPTVSSHRAPPIPCPCQPRPLSVTVNLASRRPYPNPRRTSPKPPLTKAPAPSSPSGPP